MTSQNAKTLTKPAVEHHLTLRGLKWILSELPGEAPLHAVKDYYAPDNDFASTSGENLYLDTRSRNNSSFNPATVGSFRDYLGSLEDMDDNSYVWILVIGYNAVNGVRINSDGSYTLTAENPDAMP